MVVVEQEEQNQADRDHTTNPPEDSRKDEAGQGKRRAMDGASQPKEVGVESLGSEGQNRHRPVHPLKALSSGIINQLLKNIYKLKNYQLEDPPNFFEFPSTFQKSTFPSN